MEKLFKLTIQRNYLCKTRSSYHNRCTLFRSNRFQQALQVLMLPRSYLRTNSPLLEKSVTFESFFAEENRPNKGLPSFVHWQPEILRLMSVLIVEILDKVQC